MNLKRIFCWCLKAIPAGIVSLILLSGFCWFYSFEGIHIEAESGATDYVWESNQLKSTMKEGLARLHMDADGYNNVSDYSETPDILLMGSSHMEALQVEEDQNTGYLLNEMVSDYETYNIGMSGHTIYRCVDNLENALNTYNPQKYLVMVVDTVDLSIYGMQEVINKNATPIPSYDSGVIYYLQKIPSVKVIYKQLTDWIELENKPKKSYDEKAQNENVTEEGKIELPEDYEVVLNDFINMAAKKTEEKGVQLLMVFKPSQSLQQNGSLAYGYTEEYLECFQNVCESNGVEFVNLEESFEELYQREQKLVHGFANSAVGVGHLNSDGHKVVARAIIDKIQELEAE